MVAFLKVRMGVTALVSTAAEAFVREVRGRGGRTNQPTFPQMMQNHRFESDWQTAVPLNVSVRWKKGHGRRNVPQWDSEGEERVALRAPLRKLVERQTGHLVIAKRQSLSVRWRTGRGTNRESPHLSKQLQWNEWVQRIWMRPETLWSMRSRQTGQVGSSTRSEGVESRSEGE